MKKKSIVSELFPWLNRRAIVESDFDTSIEPHPTHPPIMPDVEREPEVDHTTNNAQEFLAISLALGEEAEFRTEHYVQYHVDGGIKRVSVSYHLNPRDETLLTTTLDITFGNSPHDVTQVISIEQKRYKDLEAYAKALKSALESIKHKSKLNEFKRMMRERAETFDPVKEFNTQCQLLSSKYHTHSPLTTRTNHRSQEAFITLSLKSPKTVNWRGQEFSKDFDSVYELVLTLDKAQLSGNVKIMDGSSIINHPMNVYTYRIADELDPGWKKFFEEADATIGEYEKERADALSAAGFTGSLPDNID